MLRHEDFVREFPIVLRTNRDAENPSIIEFVKNHPVDSLLDIGAHNSWVNYAPEIRKLVREYEAIDIIPDPPTEAIVDKYYIGNANDRTIQRSYDMVICVSCFEHSGISTYKGDHKKEVLKLFKTCLLYAKKYVWVSFDIGQEYTYPNELSPITEDILSEMEKLVSMYKVKERFFYTQGSQANHPWYEHTKREVAVRIPYIDYVGNSSICCMEIEK